MTTLEKIRAEIREMQPEWHKNAGVHNCIEDVMKIIDKYAERECEDDPYQTDMDEMWKQAKQEPKTGHCKDCRWWKDKDGVYRRGIGAESSCPFNTKEIYDGDAYCYRFEPQERNNKE